MNKFKLFFSIFLIAIVINLLSFAIYIFLNNSEEKKENNPIKQEVSSDLENSLINSIDYAWESVVSIVVTRDLNNYYEDPFDFFWSRTEERREKIGWGSWIIVSKDWYILTNKHVISEAKWRSTNFTVVTRDWREFNVENIWFDPILDIAILRIEDSNGSEPSDLMPADFVSVFDEIKIWQFVIAIWNALSQFQDTATFGIVSWKWRQLEDVPADSLYVWLYQTDAPINPWNSGGPLLDINGNIIGVNTAISAMWQWIWFSIPVNKEFLKTTLNMIEEYWEIKRPFLWIEHMNLNRWVANRKDIKYNKWVYVEDVVSWTVADKAGIKKWDIITHVDWLEVWKWEPFLYQLFIYAPGNEVEFTIISDWEEKKITVELGDRK